MSLRKLELLFYQNEDSKKIENVIFLLFNFETFLKSLMIYDFYMQELFMSPLIKT